MLLGEQKRSYDTLTERIQAINTDLDRELDGDRRLTLRDRKKELIAEREEVVARMEEIDTQLTQIAELKTPAIQAKEVESEVKQPAPPVRTKTLPTANAVTVPPAPADSITIDKPIRLDLVRIPAGYFLMGTRSVSIPGLLKQHGGKQEWYESEVPQHQVYLPDFYIARVPVTVAQFRAFFEATGYQTTAEREGWSLGWKEMVPSKTWRHPSGPDSDVLRKNDHPVRHVSWQDAQAFCQWAKVRLPSEAEWEKAARGTDSLAFPWGNQAPTSELCNFSNYVSDTTPVGHYPKGASPYGILDMAGNEWEWTSSQYKAYPYDPKDGRENLIDEAPRVLRGGSFYETSSLVRCAARYEGSPEGRFASGGFRVGIARPSASGL